MTSKKILLTIIVALLSSCASNKVDLKALETKKGAVFEVAIVEVTGTLPYPTGSNNIEKKTLALEKIQVNNICDVLNREYGLQINRNVNKVIRYAPKPTSFLNRFLHKCKRDGNPYIGNRDYIESSGGCGSREIYYEQRNTCYCITNKDIGNYISIIYGFEMTGNPFNPREWFYYQITVMADGDVLVKYSGDVALLDLKTSYNPLDIGKNWEEIQRSWDNLVQNADQVDEALTRDIAKTKGEQTRN